MNQTFRITLCLVVVLSSSAWSQKLPTNPAQPTIPPVPGILEKTLTAKKLTNSEKFQFRIIQQFGWEGFVGAALSSATLQAFNRPKEWGRDWDGYGQRYASSYGTAMADQVFTYGLETALHEDPRYFPSSEKGFGRRLGSVLRQSLIAKKDDGHPTFAYARVAGAFASGFLTNAWQPASNNTSGDALTRGALNLAGDAGFFFIQEFLPIARNSHFRRRR